MKGRKITENTTFIVFDMEWNQPIPGKNYWFEASSLSGEIIEIGAVKYIYKSGSLIESGVFSCDIRPRFYTTLHYHVKKVTHKKNSDLKNGIPFEQAYKQFKDFCGPDAILAGWGTSDPDMLKTNLKFMKLNDQLKMDFIDVQPMFSLASDERGKQKSVEFAVDYFNIEKNEMFHSATADAKYTGEILRSIFNKLGEEEYKSTVETFLVNPDDKKEYTFLGSESDKQEHAFDNAQSFTTICPVCEKKFIPVIEQFRIRKSTYSMMECPDDGVFFTRARMKKSKSGKYYASAIVRRATKQDFWLVEDKKAEYDEFGSNGRPTPPKVETPQDDINVNKCDSNDVNSSENEGMS